MKTSLNWISGALEEEGPRYLAIANAMEQAIERNVLATGEKLPPHRTLAKLLGLDVTTVSRAYAEIKRRGLTSGEVGRGTFVRKRRPDAPPSLWQPPARDAFIDLSHNFPASGPDTPAISMLEEAMTRRGNTAALVGFQSDSGHLSHREAIARWLEASDITARPGELVITAGAQHGLLLAVHAVTQPDEIILCERLTFYGALSAAKFLGRKVLPVDMDAEGLLPAALERAFHTTGARTVYCNPTLHNPTTAIMGNERRHEIVAICRRHGATIIEDDVYSFLFAPRVQPLCALAPERTIHVSGFSKILGPGLRVGFVRAPGHVAPRLGAGLRATCLMAPAPMVEAVRHLLNDGGMARIATARTAQVRERQSWAQELLADSQAMSKENAFHVWLPIGAWHSEAFAAVARERGVGVAPGALFLADVDHHDEPAVRLCVSAVIDKSRLTQALRVLTELIAEGPFAARSIV